MGDQLLTPARCLRLCMHFAERSSVCRNRPCISYCTERRFCESFDQPCGGTGPAGPNTHDGVDRTRPLRRGRPRSRHCLNNGDSCRPGAGGIPSRPNKLRNARKGRTGAGGATACRDDDEPSD